MKTYYATIIILLISVFSSSNSAYEIKSVGDSYYFTNQLLIKLKDWPVVSITGRTELPQSLNSILNDFSIKEVVSVFPQKSIERSDELGRIILIKYEADIDPHYISSKIRNNTEIEWAEPKYIYELAFDPNDSSYSSQWNLFKVLAAQAWDITQGDTSVVIGIIDTGVDWDHPDLSANIWINRNEIPNNGIDDDGNSYIDDVRGWDFGGLDGTPDNDPMEDRPDHGTHVAGIASAVTNNETGIAAIGFKSKIMAVKVTQDNLRFPNGRPRFVYSYEGIVYAADNGAKIINCSWGGSVFSRFNQEVVNYATLQGALIVAAAMNTGTNAKLYPASYDNVLSVASTTEYDTKSGFSSYGPAVDVSAPGSNIFSTWQNDTYDTKNGTSMATPLAAGLAALVWSVFPGYTPLQIGERVRASSENIDGLNPQYAQLMGKGRIDAFNAVAGTDIKSVRAVEINFSDEPPGGNGDGIFLPGETISVGVRFINYLDPVSNLSVTLENKNSHSMIVNGNFNAGSKGTLEEFNNFASKFTFTLNDSLPSNANLDFILDFSDGSYSDYQWLNTIGNPSYVTQAGNDVALTITSKGNLGYNDFPNNQQGDGFKYLQGPDLLFSGALILATSATQVSDAAKFNADFTVVQPFVLNVPGTVADYQGSAIFNDDAAGNDKIGITTKLESFSFADPPHNNYIVLKYNLTNTTTSVISTLHAGLFFDWDFDIAYEHDVTRYDTINNLSFTYNTLNGPENWITTAIISVGEPSFWAIKNDGGDGGFEIYQDFTDAEKWQALSNSVGKPTAGPGDISHVIGAGPFTIQPDSTVDVGFVIGAGFTIEDLQGIVANAKDIYPNLVTTIDDELPVPVNYYLHQNYPNPFNPNTVISYQLPVIGNVTLKVYDILGNEIATLVNGYKPAGTYELTWNAASQPSGVYFYQLKSGPFVETKKMILLK